MKCPYLTFAQPYVQLYLGDKKVTYCQFYMIQTIANGILKYLLKNGSEIMMGRWKNSKGVRHCPRHKG